MALLMITTILLSSFAGCLDSSSDDDDKMTKEELIEKIRSGNASDDDTKGADLSGADLSGLQNMELFGTDFTGADLSLADFTNSDLSYSHFNDAKLSNAKFANTNLNGATFSGNYSSLTIRDSDLTSSLWGSGVLDWVRFENVDLSWAEFGGRMGEYAITLDSVWFSDSTFFWTKFHCFENEGDVRFYRNSISEMILTQAYSDCGAERDGWPDWGDTRFQQNSFTGVNLEWGNFDGATFYCNSFFESSLSYNDFTTPGRETSFSSFSGYPNNEICPQTFVDTSLEGSTFYFVGGEGTSFQGSSLDGSTFIYDGDGLSQDISWTDTVCPDGSNSDDNEDTCKNNL